MSLGPEGFVIKSRKHELVYRIATVPIAFWGARVKLGGIWVQDAPLKRAEKDSCNQRDEVTRGWR
jgi:hypothetical protein